MKRIVLLYLVTRRITDRKRLRRDRTACADIAINRRHRLLMVITGLMIGLVIDCDDTGSPRNQNLVRKNNPLGYIAFVAAGPDDPLWPVLKAGGQRHIQDGTSLPFEFLVPDSDSDADREKLLLSLLDSEIQGVCLQVRGEIEIDAGLRRLYDRGVRIVTMVYPLPERITAGHAGFDEMAVGRELALQADAYAGTDGTLMLLHAGHDHPVHGLRYLGFDDKANVFRTAELLARIDCEAGPDNARRLIRDWSQRYPRLTAWVSLDDWPLRNLSAETAALPEDCRLITFGGRPEQWAWIESGLCPRMVAADYHRIGEMAAQYCESAVRDPLSTYRTYHAPLLPLTNDSLPDYRRQWEQWAEPIPEYRMIKLK